MKPELRLATSLSKTTGERACVVRDLAGDHVLSSRGSFQWLRFCTAGVPSWHMADSPQVCTIVPVAEGVADEECRAWPQGPHCFGPNRPSGPSAARPRTTAPHLKLVANNDN